MNATYKDMNIQDLNPLQPKFEPGRPVYVLLHKDQSHIYPRPDGEAAWSYDQNQMLVTRKILATELHEYNYHVTTLAIAFPLICNRQAELEKLWRHTIETIKRIKTVQDRRIRYRRFFEKHKLPHPLIYDAVLKQLLAIE